MDLAFGTGTYKRSRLPQLTLRNLYAEKTPYGLSLRARHVTVAHATRGTAIRGLYQEDGAFSGDLFAMSGTTLYRGSTSLGTVQGSDRAEFAYADGRLYVCGGGKLYAYDGTTFAAVATPDNTDALSICEINETLVVVLATGLVYFILPGETAIDALSFFAAERRPDKAVAVRAMGDQLVVVGTGTVEFFDPTSSADLPFQRREGISYTKGTPSRDTAVSMDNSILMVSQDEAKGRTVVRFAEVPTRLSENTSIDELLNAADASDLSAFGCSMDGVEFYCLRIGAAGTYALNLATKEWSEFASYGSTFWRPWTGAGRYVGDSESGAIWTLADGVADATGALERTFTALTPKGFYGPCDDLRVECSVGETADVDAYPVMEMRWSDDGAQTWKDWRQASVGRQGQYRKRVMWRALGLVDEPRVFEFRATDAVPLAIEAVRMNDGAAGGRARP